MTINTWNPSVLVVKESNNIRYFDATTEVKFHGAVLMILTERLNGDDGWYDDLSLTKKEELREVIFANNSKLAWEFLLSRRYLVYEYVRLERLESAGNHG